MQSAGGTVAGTGLQVIGWPATKGGIPPVWQSRQLMPACGPARMAKQVSWAGKAPGAKRQAPWQPRQSVEKPACTWSSLVGSAEVRS
jgi:hypothetical protein